MNEIKEYTEKIFEDIKHIDEKGNEYWLALDQILLEKYKIINYQDMLAI